MPSGYNALAARPKNKLAYPGQDLVEAFTQGLGPMLYGAAKGTAATVAGLPGDIEQLARQLLLSGAAPDSYTAKNMAAQALLPTSDRVKAMLPSLSSFGAGPQAQYTENTAASLGQNVVGNLVAPKALPAIVRAGQGLPVGASIKTVGDVAPQVEALRLAQQRAALPVEQGGLGLPSTNTAMDRAKAMGFDTDVYHGSKQDFDKFKGDQPIFASEDPDIARLYGSFIYPLKLRGQVLEVSDLGKDGAINRFPNNLAKELNIPRKELEDLRMPRQQFNDSSFLDKLEYLFNKRFRDPQFSDIGEREMVNKLPKYGIDRLKVTDMSDMGGTQTQHMIPSGSDNIRSRFAAFDPFRRTAATAAAMGVAAPDLLAAEMSVADQIDNINEIIKKKRKK